MLQKHKAREIAMQVLFLWDAHGGRDTELAARVAEDAGAEDEARRHGLRMCSAAWDARDTADQWVERLAPQWPPRRQPGVDRAILRLAVWELTSGETPPKVVIDEAIELAKSFSTEQSPSFVNGVLDAVLKEMNALTSPASGNTNAGTETQSHREGEPPPA
ncbi:MAG TPA: transcription antitermination factor NusB [Tepidisphaeraceae bacterium]|jgi:N utilization substance protein B